MHKIPSNIIFAQENTHRMTKRKYISYLLLLFSMLMLTIPVMPHHHHANGQICMKDDVHTDCCHQHNNDAKEHNHGCEDTGCITTHFFQQLPSNNEHESHIVDVQPVEYILSYIPILFALENPKNHIDYGYRESLHDTRILFAKGLRAPPCV